jgi:prepilin-type processing-associated H-X9-DG protein
MPPVTRGAFFFARTHPRLREPATGQLVRSSGTREPVSASHNGPPLCLAQVRRPAETFNLMDGYTTTATTWSQIGRHSGGMNTGFVDGHARWLPPEELARTETDGHGFYWLRYAVANR